MKDVVPEHHIQKKIFNRLVGADKIRYSLLKPKGMEANVFMYHLKELIKMGLVQKLETGGYSLTAQGKSTATRFSIREENIRIMPSTISVIVLRGPAGEWLLYRRKRQPYIDALGFPSGKVHLGDSLAKAALRELDEKCGYSAAEVSLDWRGTFNLVEYDEQHLKNHIIGLVWYGEVGSKKIFNNHAGETFWGDWRGYPYEQFIPGFKEIIEALENPEFFALDLRFL
jgi:ADP-ribose pyrophosphatase YjhB (NUDIX family)